MTGTHQNIDRRKDAEEALRSSEERLELALKGTSAGLWDWNIQTGATIFDERWAEMLGYSLTELLPTTLETWSNLVHSDDLPVAEIALQAHFAGEIETYECEHRMRHKDGHWVWVLDTGRVVERDADGTPLRMVGTHLDITERKQAEKEIQQKSATERLIGEISSDFVRMNVRETDSRITRALETIGRFTDSDRAYLFQVRDDDSTIDNTHEWCAEGIEPQIENLQNLTLEDLGWLADQLLDKAVIHVPDVSSMPSSAEQEKKHLADQGIQSVLALPLYLGDRFAGFIGFDSVRRKRDWEPEDWSMLRFIGETIMHAISRTRSHETLQSELRLRNAQARLADAHPEYRNLIPADLRPHARLREGTDRE